jgi:hypothetical protein
MQTCANMRARTRAYARGSVRALACVLVWVNVCASTHVSFRLCERSRAYRRRERTCSSCECGKLRRLLCGRDARQVTAAIGGIYEILLAVIATLRLKFAASGACQTSSLHPLSFLPLAVPNECHKHIPALLLLTAPRYVV